MRSLVVLVLLALVAAATDAGRVHNLLREEWLAFKLQYRKQYLCAAEERARRRTFLRSRLAVARHNQRYAMRLETYRQELNQFADIPYKKFVRHYTGFRPHRSTVGRSSTWRSKHWRPYAWSANASDPQPPHVDWRTKNAVTEVKQQGECAACWAFTATGAIESHRFLRTRVLESLSEQNLVDCSGNYGNKGCSGGNADDAFMYVHDHGIASETGYPYEEVNGTCRFNRWNGEALRPGTVTGFMDVRPPDEKVLEQAVNQGPVAAGIVVTEDFRLYKNGVYYDRNCTDAHPVTHAVLVVGYGTDKAGGDYWLVKNSWGQEWGESGYARMARNRNNHCAIASYASFPLVF